MQGIQPLMFGYFWHMRAQTHITETPKDLFIYLFIKWSPVHSNPMASPPVWLWTFGCAIESRKSLSYTTCGLKHMHGTKAFIYDKIFFFSPFFFLTQQQ